MSSLQEDLCLEVDELPRESPTVSIPLLKNTGDNNRNRLLDALRGVAILLVLGRHTQITELWNKVGWSGVDLFFVLSGFLISGLLFQEYKRYGDIHLGRFWWRRGMKIYPAFYICTLLQTLVYVLMFGKFFGVPPAFHLFLVDATFMSSYFPGMSGHAWSLAVEEHFYFLLPLLLLGLVRLRPRKANPFALIPVVFVLITIASLLLRIAARPTSHLDYYTYLLPTHLRIDSLFCGVMVGYLFHFKPQFLSRIARWPLMVTGCMLLTPVYFLNVEYRQMYTWGLTTTFLGFACVLIWAIHLPYQPKHFLAFPVELLARIGFYSYSIYLWHWIIIFYLRTYVRSKCIASGNPFVWTSAMERWQWLVCLVFCIVAGIIMAIAIEQPFLRLRDRWFPSRTRQSAAMDGRGASFAETSTC